MHADALGTGAAERENASTRSTGSGQAPRGGYSGEPRWLDWRSTWHDGMVRGCRPRRPF